MVFPYCFSPFLSVSYLFYFPIVFPRLQNSRTTFDSYIPIWFTVKPPSNASSEGGVHDSNLATTNSWNQCKITILDYTTYTNTCTHTDIYIYKYNINNIYIYISGDDNLLPWFSIVVLVCCISLCLCSPILDNCIQCFLCYITFHPHIVGKSHISWLVTHLLWRHPKNDWIYSILPS